MIENFKINEKEIEKINLINEEDKNFRLKNLKQFNQKGFPSKNEEDWKFSDIKKILEKNFGEIKINNSDPKENSVRLINDFDHNYILLINGKLIKSDFKFENKDKIKITHYKPENFSSKENDNSLISLNNALYQNGFFLEIEKNYKFEKVLILYNLFTEDLSNKIINTKNKIILNKNSELHLIEYTINKSKNKFIHNNCETIHLVKDSKFKNISIQARKSEGYLHKFSYNKLEENTNYSNLIFSSGLRFYKQDIRIDLEGKNSDCKVNSALFLGKDDHQEIKTRINHLEPFCKSYQKIKSVLESNARGI